MDDLIERLHLSKGSTSQGLKFLRNISAVKMIYVAGDRRVHYEAVAELRNLSVRFLRDQIVPHLDSGQARPERIAVMVRQLPAEDRARVNGWVKMLQSRATPSLSWSSRSDVWWNRPPAHRSGRPRPMPSDRSISKKFKVINLCPFVRQSSFGDGGYVVRVAERLTATKSDLRPLGGKAENYIVRPGGQVKN
jgi:hypothetical protein